MAKREAIFTAELRAAFEQIGAWAYKIPDASIPPKSAGFRRMNIARPFDLVVCLDGRLVAVEVKQMQGFKAFGPRMMQPSQVEHLTAVEAAGGDAFVALFVHEPRKYRYLHMFCWPGLKEHWDTRGTIRGKDLAQRTSHRADWTRPQNRTLPARFCEELALYRAGKNA